MAEDGIVHFKGLCSGAAVVKSQVVLNHRFRQIGRAVLGVILRPVEVVKDDAVTVSRHVKPTRCEGQTTFVLKHDVVLNQNMRPRGIILLNGLVDRYTGAVIGVRLGIIPRHVAAEGHVVTLPAAEAAAAAIVRVGILNDDVVGPQDVDPAGPIQKRTFFRAVHLQAVHDNVLTVLDPKTDTELCRLLHLGAPLVDGSNDRPVVRRTHFVLHDDAVLPVHTVRQQQRITGGDHADRILDRLPGFLQAQPGIVIAALRADVVGSGV